jgi:hypothetical protein
MPAGTFETIETRLLTSSQSAIVFSSIPQTYTDLVIVLVPISNGTNFVAVQFNTDTSAGGTNYSRVTYSTGGTGPFTDQRSNRYAIEVDYFESTGTGPNTTNEIHIFNYTTTAAFKTILSKNSASDRNAGGVGVGTGVGTWRNTEAINSVRLSLNAGTFSSGTRATIYGIKAA